MKNKRIIISRGDSLLLRQPIYMNTIKLLLPGIGIIVICAISFCNHPPRNKSYAHVPESSIRKGKQLAEKYCQSCHLLPDPSLLDAGTWDDGVLPNMGPWLGIFSHQYRRYPVFADSSLYPSQPILSGAEWQHIINYYTATAPDSLPPQQRPFPIGTTLPLFEIQQPVYRATAPAVCFVAIDTTRFPANLVIADYGRRHIYRLDASLEVIDSIYAGGAVVDMHFTRNAVAMLDIGEMVPNNGRLGKIKSIQQEQHGAFITDTVPVIRNLARPVCMEIADLDVDGRPDYVVGEFGFLTGALSWYRNAGNNQWERRVLRTLPGAMQIVVHDYNRDQLPDLWVLFAQGEEGVFLYTNRGNGRFEEQQVLRLPPSYGSTFFELVDFNGDGYGDIVYTCGDNADFSPVLKPYHGVYIFLNDGSNHFTQHFFYPANGCYKALARDYDADGDLDIATISFFADYVRQPEESFVYLENRGDSWRAYTFPQSVRGRWLTMEAGDLDGDGRIDLVLGNFSKAPAMMEAPVDWSKGPMVVYLRQKGDKKIK
jgi:hypothetical protein